MRNSSILVASLVLLSACQSEPTVLTSTQRPDRAEDGRLILYLDAADRAHISEEMRNFLAGVQALSEAMLEGDRPRIAETARGMGRKEAPTEIKAMILRQPPEFREFGQGMRGGFDDIADMAPTAAMPDIQRAVADNLHACSACHATFTARDASPR